jgi:hypothetical protein
LEAPTWLGLRRHFLLHLLVIIVGWLSLLLMLLVGRLMVVGVSGAIAAIGLGGLWLLLLLIIVIDVDASSTISCCQI